MSAPADAELRKEALERALRTAPPLYIEDSEAGPGLCSICAKEGVHGRCIAPLLPGKPQPCPRCSAPGDTELEANELYPHQLEVGAQVRRKKALLGGVEASALAPVPHPMGRESDGRGRPSQRIRLRGGMVLQHLCGYPIGSRLG